MPRGVGGVEPSDRDSASVVASIVAVDDIAARYRATVDE